MTRVEVAHREATFNDAHRLTIAVSYAWDVDDDGNGASPRKSPRWRRIRGLLKSVSDETIKRAKGMDPDHRVNINIERLRSRHGANILASLKARLEKADIYVADISDRAPAAYNPNVMLELGMAISLGLGDSDRMFVLTPRGMKTPSDLSGILFTEYEGENDGWRLVDQDGFRAALRTQLLGLARNRGLLTPSRAGQVSIDEEDGKPQKTGSSRSSRSSRAKERRTSTRK